MDANLENEIRADGFEVSSVLAMGEPSTEIIKLAKSSGALLKFTVTPSVPAARAVAIPTRKPPNAVAKNTAGK